MERNITTAALTLSLIALAGPAHAQGDPTLDMTGKGLPAALKSLNNLEQLDVKGVSRPNRNAVWPPMWKVCLQQPAPGASREIQQVKFAVVKRAERCP
ncbi:hypothetical protein ACQUSR_29980 [Streptomyces sp. P1-3]|uniref:hypothetical protein n=1 Tax=Streptomyces sp. P1-3 TaxID=3421658 RepID=UPI003D35C49A